MYPVKQSTALTVPFFAFDANGDGVTGKVDGDWTKRISKGGGAFAAMTVTVTEMENGWYSLPLGTGHTDTLDILSVSLVASGVKRVNLQFRVSVRLPDDLAFPTTSGRSIDVTTTGEVGIDWANIGGPTTTQNLSGTTIKTATDVETDTADIQSRLPAALVSGRIDASVGAMANGTVTAAAIATDAIDADALADGAITAATFAAGAIDANAIAADAIGSSELAASAVTEIQAGLSTLDAAGVRAAVGLASANLDTQLTAIDDFLDTEVAAIKAKTDSLTFTVAGKVDANPTAINGDATSAANLAKTTRAVCRGTVGGGATTTSIPTSAFTPAGAAADQFKGRIVTFDADTTTAALRGQATDITTSTNAATPTLTVTALTTAPASGDTFSVT